MSLTKEHIIQIIKQNKSYLNQRFGILHMALFGSYATNTQHKDSDIDLLFENDAELGMSLGRLNNLEKFINSILPHAKIELVNKKNIHPVVFETAKPNLVEIF